MLVPISASAPGKVILVGEHAVVYGVPAIAIPVPGVRAIAAVSPAPAGSGIWLQSTPNGERVSISLTSALSEDPMQRLVQSICELASVTALDVEIYLESAIPIASGLGSGAAVATAVGRALARYLNLDLTNDVLNALVYEVEKLHHGTPSGIDNTVIVFEKPVYFRRGSPIEPIQVERDCSFLVADTGVSSSTKAAVDDVRMLRERSPHFVDVIFSEISSIVTSARSVLSRGDLVSLGKLMLANHHVLQSLKVSSHCLDRLVNVAIQGGAFGAKLSGGGRGGNMIALVPHENIERISTALLAAGAVRVIEARLDTSMS